MRTEDSEKEDTETRIHTEDTEKEGTYRGREERIHGERRYVRGHGKRGHGVKGRGERGYVGRWKEAVARGWSPFAVGCPDQILFLYPPSHRIYIYIYTMCMLKEDKTNIRFMPTHAIHTYTHTCIHTHSEFERQGAVGPAVGGGRDEGGGGGGEKKQTHRGRKGRGVRRKYRWEGKTGKVRVRGSTSAGSGSREWWVAPHRGRLWTDGQTNRPPGEPPPVGSAGPSGGPSRLSRRTSHHRGTEVGPGPARLTS